MHLRPHLAAVVLAVGAAVLAAPAVAAPVPDGGVAPGAGAGQELDTDGDALPDVWETTGYDADGDGTIDVDLPALGADPMRADLFVEMDHMDGLLPSTTALDRITAVFADAPVDNPDGSTGVSIHLDAGPARGAGYDLGGANTVPYDADLAPAEAQTEAIRATNLDPARDAVFHYGLWADSYDGDCSSGKSFGIPGDTFIVTVGPACGWDATEDEQVGTFVHELGHNLGLRHGGADDINFKPNYLSVMNYSFQFGGVRRVGGGSSFGYSDSATIPLDERNLTEQAGLGADALASKTAWFCRGVRKTGVRSAGRPIDWNCNGTASDARVRADLNDDGVQSVLTAQDNWASLVFGGGRVGADDPSAAVGRLRPSQVGVEELTRQQVEALDLRATDG